MIPFDVNRSPLPVRRTVLEASAGTGKTYTLEGLFVRMLLEGGKVQQAPEILVVTFTKAATQDLKQRLRSALTTALAAFRGEPTDGNRWQDLASEHGAAGARVLEDALRALDQVTISTIHSFCKLVLDGAAFHCGKDFTTEFVEDDHGFVRDACAAAFRRVAHAELPTGAAVLRWKGHDLETICKHYRDWQRFPSTRLEPELDAAAELVALDRVLRSTVAAYTRAEVELALVAYNGKDACPWSGRIPAYLDRLDMLLETQPLGGLAALEELCSLSLRQLQCEKFIRKRPRPSVLPTHPFFEAAKALEDQLEKAQAALLAQMLRDAHEQLQQSKREARVRSFQDLLVELHELLADEVRGPDLVATIRQRWKVALVDECQDTDPLQYAIFDRCFGDELLLVGDPKQSIYAFRGADLRAYLKAAANSDRLTLDKNHRSHPDLVEAVVRLFQRAGKRPFVTDGIDIPHVTGSKDAELMRLHGNEGMPLCWRMLQPGSCGPDGLAPRTKWETSLRVDVVDQCRSFLGGKAWLMEEGKRRDLRPRDIAILVRSNLQGRMIQQALQDQGIPATIARLADVFSSDEAAELEILAHAVLDPGTAHLQQAARATIFWGRTATELTAEGTVAASLQADLELVRELLRSWRERGFMAMFVKALEARQLRARMLLRQDGERRLTNWFQVAELLQAQATKENLGPEQLLRWFEAERHGEQPSTPEEREIRLESDEDAVQILTVHTSKGLEFEVTLLPFVTVPMNGEKKLATGPLLSRDEEDNPVFDLSSKPTSEHQERAARENLAEDLRLLYVGLTRAKRRCIVWHVCDKTAPQSALAWLLHHHGLGPNEAEFTRNWHEAVEGTCGMWRTQLEQFVAAHSTSMSFEEVPFTEPRAESLATPPRPSGKPLPAFLPLPVLEKRTKATVSFSMLTNGSHVETAIDHDDTDRDENVDAERKEVSATGMFGLRGGKGLGTCLHSIFEVADFQDPKGDHNRKLVEQLLAAHGLADPDTHQGVDKPAEVVCQMLDTVLRTEIPSFGFSLCQLDARARRDEWRFLLGIGGADRGALGRILMQSGEACVRRVGEELARGTFIASDQMLGFVDLVCHREGRWYVFDWKSNHLGDDPSCYEAEHLERAMTSSSYVLQYHLYTAALHRHLQARLRDRYSYEDHVGGICWAFLRGIGHTATSGWFVRKPEQRLIEALAAELSRSKEAT